MTDISSDNNFCLLDVTIISNHFLPFHCFLSSISSLRYPLPTRLTTSSACRLPLYTSHSDSRPAIYIGVSRLIHPCSGKSAKICYARSARGLTTISPRLATIVLTFYHQSLNINIDHSSSYSLYSLISTVHVLNMVNVRFMPHT